jgi:hypothetical protein
MAAPVPWITRDVISRPGSTARPPAMLAATNTTSPIRYSRARPYTSAGRPPSSKNPPKATAYANPGDRPPEPSPAGSLTTDSSRDTLLTGPPEGFSGHRNGHRYRRPAGSSPYLLQQHQLRPGDTQKLVTHRKTAAPGPTCIGGRRF